MPCSKTTVPAPNAGGLLALGLTLPLLLAGHALGQARPLASWLDDGKILKPGTGMFGFSFERWQSSSGAETDVPVIDLAVGVANRVQLGATVPLYRAHYASGFQGSGLGDAYLVSKVGLLDSREHRVRLAVSPLLEILSDVEILGPTRQISRINWMLPVILELEGDATRAYFTSGYASRGAVFADGAMEGDLSATVTVAGDLNFSHATGTLATLNPALNRLRVDADVTLYLQPSPSVMVFVSLGRTLTKVDVSGATLIVSAGVTVDFGKAKHGP
jgi:hypothetical protein